MSLSKVERLDREVHLNKEPNNPQYDDQTTMI